MNCYMAKHPLILISSHLVLFVSSPLPNTIETSLLPEAILVFFLAILMARKLTKCMTLLLRRLFLVEMFSFMKPIFHFIISLTLLLPFLCHPLFSYILTLLTLLSLRLRYPHLLFPLQPLLLPSPHPLLTLIASPLHLPLVPLKISSLSPYLLMSIFPP